MLGLVPSEVRDFHLGAPSSPAFVGHKYHCLSLSRLCSCYYCPTSSSSFYSYSLDILWSYSRACAGAPPTPTPTSYSYSSFSPFDYYYYYYYYYDDDYDSSCLYHCIVYVNDQQSSCSSALSEPIEQHPQCQYCRQHA